MSCMTEHRRPSIPRHGQAHRVALQPALRLLLLPREVGALPRQRRADDRRGRGGVHPPNRRRAAGALRDAGVAGRRADADGPRLLPPRPRGRARRAARATGRSSAPSRPTAPCSPTSGPPSSPRTTCSWASASMARASCTTPTATTAPGRSVFDEVESRRSAAPEARRRVQRALHHQRRQRRRTRSRCTATSETTSARATCSSSRSSRSRRRRPTASPGTVTDRSVALARVRRVPLGDLRRVGAPRRGRDVRAVLRRRARGLPARLLVAVHPAAHVRRGCRARAQRRRLLVRPLRGHAVPSRQHHGDADRRARARGAAAWRSGRRSATRCRSYCRECEFLFACNGECPKNRILLTPDGEPGLNWLCEGLKHFFAHTDRLMRAMAAAPCRGPRRRRDHDAARRGSRKHRPQRPVPLRQRPQVQGVLRALVLRSERTAARMPLLESRCRVPHHPDAEVHDVQEGDGSGNFSDSAFDAQPLRPTCLRRFAVSSAVLLFHGAKATYVERWRTSERVVVLTFDDGPHPVHTPATLEILKSKGVPAMFFVPGTTADRVRDIRHQDYDPRHVTASHGLTHAPMRDLSWREQVDELQQGEAKLARALQRPDTQEASPYLRSPRGEVHPLTLLHTSLDGRVYVGWSSAYDKQEHFGIEDQAKRVAAYCESVRPGDIILMHDGNEHGAADGVGPAAHHRRAQGARLPVLDPRRTQGRRASTGRARIKPACRRSFVRVRGVAVREASAPRAARSSEAATRSCTPAG